MLSRIARKVQCAAQWAMPAVVVLGMNLLASTAALTSHSAVVTQAKPEMIVDRSQKGDRLIPAAPEIKVVLPHGCESSVSSTTEVTQSDLLWRCVT